MRFFKSWGIFLLFYAGVMMAGEENPTYSHRLMQEIRCVTCPNQSIADSQAPIAVAMREDIERRLAAGESEKFIREYLISRYGDYISYRPRVSPATWILWGSPLICLTMGVGAWWFFAISKRRRILS